MGARNLISSNVGFNRWPTTLAGLASTYNVVVQDGDVVAPLEVLLHDGGGVEELCVADLANVHHLRRGHLAVLALVVVDADQVLRPGTTQDMNESCLRNKQHQRWSSAD